MRKLEYESKEAPARPAGMATILAKESSRAMRWFLGSAAAFAAAVGFGWMFRRLEAAPPAMAASLLALFAAGSAAVHGVMWVYIRVLRARYRRWGD